MPKVSVVIPTYNCKDYVQEAINSVLAQTYRDFELIVVDDGSTDGTGEVLKQFHSQIRYVYQKNQGSSAAQNRGIRMASGQLVAFLDHDDLWLPHKLERQVAYLDAHPDVALVCSSVLTIDADGSCLSRETEERFHLSEGQLPFETIFFRCPVLTSTVLTKREALIQAGLFDVTLRYGDDYDMWVRLALQSPIAFIPEPLAYYRVHGGNTSALVMSRPEEVDRWLSDALRNKEKIYRCWPADLGDVEEVKQRVTATHLAQAAILDFVHGRSDRGAKRLGKAVVLDPEHWANAAALEDLAFGYALTIACRRGQEYALELLDSTFEHAPPEIADDVAQAKRRVLARLHVTLAFRSHSLGHRRQTWLHAVRGLWYDPRWVCNRGLLSIAVQAWFGRAPILLLRRFRGGQGA